MRERNFRTRVTQGVFTLPAATVVATLLWLTMGIGNLQMWEGWAITAVSTYLLAELNNRTTLLRIRSRMVSTSFIALTAACPFFYVWSRSMIPALCLIVAYFPLLNAYGQMRSAGLVFHAGLSIGIGSLVYPPLLLLAPFLIVCVAGPLRALSWRSFLGLLFGLLLPYWLLFGKGLLEDNVAETFAPYLGAFHFQKPDYSTLTLPEILIAAYVTLLSLFAMLYFSRTAYDDKIKTRMYYYVFIILEFVFLAALAAQPQQADTLLRLYIINNTPLIAHHFTLGRGRWLNIWFILCLLCLVGILAFNMIYLHAGIS